MEQARCWMWTKQNNGFNSHIQPSTANPAYDDSWEEQAFAEDAAGPLGGCIWPPRSYSCSFCRREFRSAQALGGHMNVHRRDRARLKQSSISPHNEFLHHHHHHVQNSLTSSGSQYPSSHSQVCALVYNPNPNSDIGVMASPSSPNSRVSAPPTKETSSEQTIVVPPFSSPKSCSNMVSGRHFCVFDSKLIEENDMTIVESGYKTRADFVKPDLSVSLNLVVCRARSVGEDDEPINRKRRKTDASSLPLFLKRHSADKNHIHSEVLELSSSSLEELDLELRLGDRPKVK